MTTASIKKELQLLGANELWEIVSYAQSLLRKSQMSEKENMLFLEAEYEAAQKFQLNENELVEINSRRTALLDGTDKGLSHEEVMRRLKTN
ncbi:MAG: hypothetical protein AAF847_20325 [Bacteroidota bacterium]